MTMTRSSAGIAPASERSRVLLPEPVAPLTTMLRRRLTASTSRAAASPLSAPAATHEDGPANGIESGRIFQQRLKATEAEEIRAQTLQLRVGETCAGGAPHALADEPTARRVGVQRE